MTDFGHVGKILMKTILLISLAFIALCTTGCRTKRPPPPPPLPPGVELDSAYMADWGASIRYHQAVEKSLKTYTKYSASKRRRFYPFNRASSVQLAYFDHKDADGNRTLPLQNGAVDLREIDGIVHLNRIELDTLTDILYNSGYRVYIGSRTRKGCYYPRNAIFFSDCKNSIFDYIEICFDCHQFQKSRGKVRFDADGFSDRSLELLEAFFNRRGLTTTGTK